MIDTQEQIDIYNEVELGEGNIVIRARAGSGKTWTLVNITKKLPKNKSKTFIAFNKHIQLELKTKLPSDVYCYTSHGLGYSAIKRKYKDVEVDELKVDKVLGKHLKKWDLSHVANIYEYISKMKIMINLIRMTLTFDQYQVLDLAERYDLKFDLEDTKRVFLILEEMLNDKKTIDFTDMIYLPVVDKKIWLFPQDYVLVDEAQDFSKAQHELVKKLIKWDKATGKPTTRMIFCGDDLQCQPKNTKILLGSGDEILIQHLNVGDFVTTYDSGQRRFAGYKRSNEFSYKVERIKKVKFTGELIVINSKSLITKYTPNHKCFIRFKKDTRNKHALYLMEKDGQYIIGIAPLWRNSNGDSITARAEQENCNRFWILDIYETKFEAYLKKLYHSINNSFGFFDKTVLESKAINLIRTFKRNINYPIWIKGGINKLSRNYISIINACNINKEFMEVVHFDKSSFFDRKDSQKIFKPKYQNIDELTYEMYNDYVYSLKIEKHEAYVADGILTHNSIYGFTGADTNSFNNLTRFPNTKVLPLTTTFRCAKNIVTEANKIVPDIRAMETAEDGIVRIGSVIDEAGDGDFVLARKTLPLIRLFFNFLILRKKATIKGSDFGVNLLHMVEGQKSLSQLGALLVNNLRNFREKLEHAGVLDVEEHTGYIIMVDKKDVLEFLMKMVNSIDELKQLISSIFKENVTDGIILSTIHKAKGLEANRVFIVRPDEIPLGVAKGWMYQQELNLKYIAITRAKKELIYDTLWREDDIQTPTGDRV